MFGDDSFGAQPLSSFYYVVVVSGNRIRVVLCSGSNNMQLLKQSTAATVLVGPVLDSTGASYASAVIGDFNITKNGTTAAMASAATATHSHNGMYLILFTTGNTDTVGMLDISCNKATYAMPVKTFEVLTASTFDAIVTNAATAAGGLLDSVRIGGTTQTGRDIGASVLLSSGTGTGQVKLSGGYVAPNWGDVGNATTALALTGTTIASTQKVDIETIKTNPVVNAGTVTFPSNATLASTTNITAAAGITLGNTSHGGSSATITLQSINVSNSTGNAVTISSTGSDGHAIYASGNGGGDGMHIVGGSTGHGLHLQGGSTSGDGLHTVAQTAGDGIQATGAGAGVDINGTLSAVTLVNGLAANTITATSIASDAITDAKVASDVTIASVTGSVGSISGVTFPTNFSVLSISATTGLVDITQAAADKAWNTSTRLLTAGTNIVLAKGVGLTGLNDIAATAIVSAGAITTSSGAVSSVIDVEKLNGSTVVHTGGKLWALNENGDPISTGLSTFDVSTDTVLANVKEINDSIPAAQNLGAVYAAFENGTAQGGGASTITLRAGASSQDDLYNNQAIFLLEGTGAGQTNRIIATGGYDGTSKVATVHTPWAIQPDNTTKYFILGRIG